MFRIITLFFCFFLCEGYLFAQKKIELTHLHRGGEKTYNVDGAEIYLLTGGDTIFIPKVDKYVFMTDTIIDRKISKEQSINVLFLVKTPSKSYLIEVLKELYEKWEWFRFHFYYSSLYKGDYGAVTYPSGVSSNARAVIVPNKEWKKKFSPHLR